VIRQPAFIVECRSCKGTGSIQFGSVDVHCVGCNGYGKTLEIVTPERMMEWCERASQNRRDPAPSAPR
jgi:DnaJ-class molecular chaperone